MQKEKKSLRLTFPKLPPYEKVDDFLTSRFHLTKIHLYEGDGAREDPYMQLTSTSRAYETTEDLLKKKREFAKKARVKLDQQWQELYEKEKSFRDTFEKMNSFIQTNLEKRRRAKLRYEEDHVITMKRIKDIEKVKKLKEFAEASKVEMEQDIEKLKQYEQFLNKVVSLTEDFKNSDDLIARYETLLETRDFLGERQHSNLKELETAKMRTAKMLQENTLHIMGLNNVVADLRERYSTAFRRSLHWEQQVSSIRFHMYNQHQEISAVKQSCWNLYILMCRRMGEEPSIEEEDVEKQLIFIKKMLQVLKTMAEVSPESITAFNVRTVKKVTRTK